MEGHGSECPLEVLYKRKVLLRKMHIKLYWQEEKLEAERKDRKEENNRGRDYLKKSRKS